MLRPYDVNTLSIRLYIYIYPPTHYRIVCLFLVCSTFSIVQLKFIILFVFWFDFSMVLYDFAVNCELAISEWGFLKKGDPQNHWF